MRIAAIINPVAGAGPRGRLRDLWTALNGAGHRLDRRLTTGPGRARDLATNAVAASYDAVLVVGGDGTVCEVADGLAGSLTPLLIWPTGTENLVANSLGFRPRPDALLAALQNPLPQPLDLGQADGRSFVVVAGVGFDAEVVRRLARLRAGHITHLSYAGPLWRTFWEHRWPTLHITAQTPTGPFTWHGRGMAFVANMARYALGLNVVRDARPDDGLLDLLAMDCNNRRQLLGHALRTLRRRHIEHPAVRHVRCTRLTLAADQPVPVEIDGDCAGLLPLNVAVRPNALRVLIPPRYPPPPPSRQNACEKPGNCPPKGMTELITISYR